MTVKKVLGNIGIYLTLAMILSAGIIILIITGVDSVILTLTGIILFLIIFINMVLIFRMKRSCNIIKKKLKEIPEKGLTYLVELDFDVKGSDEIGQLSHHLNIMLQEIKKVFWDIKENLFETKISISALESMKLIMVSYIQKVVNIGNVREQFETICKRLSFSTSSTKTILGSIIDLANQTNSEADAIIKTSKALETLLTTISVITGLTRDKQKMAEELIKITQLGGEKVKKTSDIITILNENADEMLKIIEIINNITESTNILSINAGIEAAHAGIHGKGFRVIADEIMKLVESTKKNASDISMLLRDQVHNINVALSESNESGKAFKDVNEEVESAANIWIEISNKTEKMAEETQAIQETTSRMFEITKTVQEASEAIKRNVEKINQETLDLDETSTRTLDILEKVTVTNEEAKQSTVTILRQLNEMSKFVNALNKSIDFFNLGKKVYFLFTDESTNQYINISLLNEIEAYNFSEHTKLKNILKKQGNSILLINCENLPSGFQLPEYVKSLIRLPELKNINIGLLTRSTVKPFPELGIKQKCEYIILKHRKTESNANEILAFIEKNKARGLRSQIRVDCEESDMVRVSLSVDKQAFIGRVINISSAALLCYIEADLTRLKGSKKIPITLNIKEKALSLVCNQCIEKQEHHFLLIFEKGMDPDTKKEIFAFIRSKLDKHFEETLNRFGV